MFENDHDDRMTDLASTIASVTVNEWENKIDINVSASFSMPPSIEQCLNPSSDVAFLQRYEHEGTNL